MIGVLLLGYGAPDSVDAVEHFLTNLMGERRPAGEQLEKVKERYRLIGGRSPLLEITRKQAAALEKKLQAQGLSAKIYVGMRYWHPLIEETIGQIIADGVTKVVVLSLSPHYSRTTTGAYFQELNRVVTEKAPAIQVIDAPAWHTNPLFLKAIVDKIREGLENFPADVRSEVEVIFSAHSLPARFIKEGDVYVDQLQETLDDVIELFCPEHWQLAYQSRAGREEDWLGPDVESVLKELAKKGRNHVLLVPIGFTADHVETLYDIDIHLRRIADDLGLDFHRAAALNDSPGFIAMLADQVRRSIGSH